MLSIGKVVADGATNIIPDTVYMEGTMRTFDQQLRESIWAEVEAVAADVDRHFGTTTEVVVGHGYPSVINDGVLTDLVRGIAAEQFEVVELARRYTAEDFGFYTTCYPSVFYRLGVGAVAGRSHTSTFATDERAIAVGIELMTELAVKVK